MGIQLDINVIYFRLLISDIASIKLHTATFHTSKHLVLSASLMCAQYTDRTDVSSALGSQQTRWTVCEALLLAWSSVLPTHTPYLDHLSAVAVRCESTFTLQE